MCPNCFICNHYPCAVCRQGTLQVLKFNSNMKTIKLMVEVTNFSPGEDAHQAKLDVTIPDALKYSGVRSDQVCPLEGAREDFISFLNLIAFGHASCGIWIAKFTLTMCSGPWCTMHFWWQSDLWPGEPTKRQWKGTFEQLSSIFSAAFGLFFPTQMSLTLLILMLSLSGVTCPDIWDVRDRSVHWKDRAAPESVHVRV